MATVDSNLITSIDPIETDDHFAASHDLRARSDRRFPLCMVRPSGDPAVPKRGLRREWPACLADAHRLVRFQASQVWFEYPVKAQLTLSLDPGRSAADRTGTVLALYEVAETPHETIQPLSSDKGTAATGRFSSLAVDARSRLSGPCAAREWRFRKPNRRDSQCVPI
jgi:hypothetical protein